ncbi:MAG: LppX_LprAFG lipoprotein [Chloroflexota bacterium]|nr:LppX_LprAFG lipoprotein [Chloroflexota bacterium]
MPRPGFICRRTVRALAMTVVIVLGIAACGGQPAPEPTSTVVPRPTPTAADLLERASRRVAETTAVHYALTISGDTFLDTTETIRLVDAEGDLQRPDRVYSSFRAEILGRTITLQLITVGPDSWTTDILSGEWVAAPGEFAYKPGILFDNQDGIGPVMDRISNPERLDDAEIDGRLAYRIEATVDQATIGPLTSYLLTSPAVIVNLWIDRETDDLLRAELSQPASEPDGEPTTWTLDLSRHGEDVSIEPPV